MQIPQLDGPRLQVGTCVRVRRQRWTVVSVQRREGVAIVVVRGRELANAGVERRFLLPFERVETIRIDRRLRLVSSSRWRQTCRHLIATDSPATALHTARRAQIDLHPHQLEPALAVVRGLTSRVLIADEVGLGKTIQAGLVVSELVARGAAERILVVTPAGLRAQWADELGTRFGLPLAVFDRAEIRQRRSFYPVGVNPWSTEAMVIASLDHVKRAEVLPAVESCRWDVVVLDEAHGAVALTDRHSAAAVLTRGSPYVVLLTATPHNGDATAFASLCALGDHGDDLLIFRRTRQEVGLAGKRRVHQLVVRSSPAELSMHARLTAFVRAVEHDHDGRKGDVHLALATLRKRALSSAFALERSVRRRLDVLGTKASDPFEQLRLPMGEPDEDADAADDLPPWLVPALRDADEEQRLLTTLAESARVASAAETKLNALARLLRRLGEPVIVFTEYRDTLAHVQAQVAPGATILHGGLSRDDRRDALGRFSRGQVLLATDAASEGLNLHHHCRAVINLELPWNPMRLEQRIGRVDRIGQSRTVHVFHLVAGHTHESLMIERLGGRIARAQEALGAADPLRSERDGPIDQTSHPTTRLVDEAAAEHARLRIARRVAHSDANPGADDLFSSGPLAVRARTSATRRQLGMKTLVVYQSTLHDRRGLLVGHHLTPVLVAGRGGRGLALAELDELEARIDDPSIARWLEDLRGTQSAFWARRARREDAIASFLGRALTRTTQPGLFDLRAVHQRELESDDLANLRRESQCRQAVCADAAALEYDGRRVVLVLFP